MARTSNVMFCAGNWFVLGEFASVKEVVKITINCHSSHYIVVTFTT